MKQVIIDGNNFSNLEGFFNEIERLLAPNHNWRIHAFNTFDDVLHGGYGFHEPFEELEITWINAAKSRKDLGYEETVRYLESQAGTWLGISSDSKVLADARNHLGPTLFDRIVEQITDSYNTGHVCSLTIKEGK